MGGGGVGAGRYLLMFCFCPFFQIKIERSAKDSGIPLPPNPVH